MSFISLGCIRPGAGNIVLAGQSKVIVCRRNKGTIPVHMGEVFRSCPCSYRAIIVFVLFSCLLLILLRKLSVGPILKQRLKGLKKISV